MNLTKNEIRDGRLKACLTQLQAALMVPVTPSTWSLYERGHRVPSRRTMKLIVQVLVARGGIDAPDEKS